MAFAMPKITDSTVRFSRCLDTSWCLNVMAEIIIRVAFARFHILTGIILGNGIKGGGRGRAEKGDCYSKKLLRF